MVLNLKVKMSTITCKLLSISDYRRVKMVYKYNVIAKLTVSFSFNKRRVLRIPGFLDVIVELKSTAPSVAYRITAVSYLQIFAYDYDIFN